MLVGDILRVLDILGAQNVDVVGKNVQLSCLLAPWKHDKKEDRSPSMGVKIDPFDRSLVNCFSCHFGGTLTMLVEQLEIHTGTDYGELELEIEELDTPDPAKLVLALGEYDAPAESSLVEDVTVPEVYLETFGKGHEDYMHGRNFRDVTLETWGVCFDEKKQRVVFPIRRWDGRLVGATGRDITGLASRWWNYFSVQKSRHLFGLHLLPGREHLVVVEGKCDALRVWQETREFDKPVYPVAIMGSKASKRQLELLVEHSEQITLFLDNDPAGTAGTRGLIDALVDVVPLFRARYPDSRKDPDALGEDVREAILKARLV